MPPDPRPEPELRERAQIARLFLNLMRTSRNALAPGMTLYKWSGYVAIGSQVLIGQAQGRPLTASDIARHLEMPRPTVLRRLKTMTKLGIVERKGRLYFRGSARAADETHDHMQEQMRNLRLICAELFKMDENPS
jgi:DNA-binding transcriptional ArsR family regulator